VIRHRIRRDSHRINNNHDLKLLLLDESAERPCCARPRDGAAVQLSWREKKKPAAIATGSRAHDAIHRGQISKWPAATAAINAAYAWPSFWLPGAAWLATGSRCHRRRRQTESCR
jgi:hypothetical protein